MTPRLLVVAACLAGAAIAQDLQPPTEGLRIPESGYSLEQLLEEFERIRGIRFEVPETLSDGRRNTELRLNRELVVAESELDAVLSSILRAHSIAISGISDSGFLKLHDLARESLSLGEPLLTALSLAEARFGCQVVRVPVTFEHLSSEVVVQLLHDEFQVDEFTADAVDLGTHTVLIQGEADRVEEWIAIFRAADRPE